MQWRRHYYRIVGGDRLMWGGGLTSRKTSSRRLGQILRRRMLKVFPQLGDVEITHAWSGVMGYAMHRMPLIGGNLARPVGRDRVRRPRHQHHRDGGRPDRARDRGRR